MVQETHETRRRSSPAGQIYRHLALVTVLFALVCLCLALTQPFMSNDFRIDLSKADYLGLWKNIIPHEPQTPHFLDDPRGWIRGKEKNIVSTVGTEAIDRYLDQTAVHNLNHRLEKYAREKGGIRSGTYYLPQMIRGLFKGKEYFVALAITAFSVLFPATKIFLLTLCLLPWFSSKGKRQIKRWITLTSKWTMADVFIAALIVFFFKATGFHYQFHLMSGFYFYVGSFCCSTISAAFLSRHLQSLA